MGSRRLELYKYLMESKEENTREDKELLECMIKMPGT